MVLIIYRQYEWKTTVIQIEIAFRPLRGTTTIVSPLPDKVYGKFIKICMHTNWQ